MAIGWLPLRLASKRTVPAKGKERRSFVPELQFLEDRITPVGSWSNLAATNPGLFGSQVGQAMMLLSDGTVAIQKGADAPTRTWFRLTPNANGSYVNGTWSTMAGMNEGRLFFTTALLPDGRIFAVGGEYSDLPGAGEVNTAEIYDPLTNVWTRLPNVPTAEIGDSQIEVLPSGNVLVSSLVTSETFIYNPTTNTWSNGPNKLRGDIGSEESWVKLSDGSILSYDVWSSINTGVFHAQRYVPSLNAWVDASGVNAANPPSLLSRGSEGFELGPALRLPDGRVMFFGTEGHTAFYSETTGLWSAGPNEPTVGGVQYVSTDSPGAILPNGKILITLSPIWTPGNSFPAPTHIFEFDPAANAYTDVTPGGSINNNAFFMNMLMLPTGQVLMANSNNAGFKIYTPDGAPQDAWRPVINSIVDNGNGTYTMAGTQLNGLSEGATYGDDWMSSCNYPIIRFTDFTGKITYARSYNWDSTGVATGAFVEHVTFVLPPGKTLNDYDTVEVIGAGIASLPRFINIPPTARNDGTYSTPEDTPLVVNAAAGVLVNDTDPEGDGLSAVLLANAAHGNVVLNPDGSFTYTPNANYNGPDSFTYRAFDGHHFSAAATVTLNIDPVPDTPIATDDPGYFVQAGFTLNVGAPGVLANDIDVDGGLLFAFLSGAAPTKGTLNFNNDGSFSYTAFAGATGNDTFQYRASNGLTNSNLATVTIKIDSPPVAAADSYSMVWNQQLSVPTPGVLANDSDIDGDPLSAELVTSTAHGSLTFVGTGGFIYTPNAYYYGTDSFTYRVRDAYFTGNTVTVTILVEPQPVAGDDSYSAFSGRYLDVGAPGVLMNDVNLAGGPLTAVLASGPRYGSVTLNADGSFRYLAVNNYVGTDSFTYRARTAGGVLSNLATVRLTVTLPPNQPPTANDDLFQAFQGAPLQVGAPGVLGNDTDPEGDPLAALLVSGTTHGLLGLAADGSFSYTANAGFVGTDSFTYRVTDGPNFSNVATVTIQVNAGGPPPNANADAYGVVTGQSLTVGAPGVLLNDVDPLGRPLSAQLGSAAAHGALSFAADGSFVYTPFAGYTGTDSFTYRAVAGGQLSGLATVTLTVTNPILPPRAVADSYQTVKNVPLNVPAWGVLGNDSDPQALPLTAVLVGGAAHGVVTLNPDGSFTYLPALGYVGPDSFTYQASNGVVLSNVATVSVNVIPGAGGPGQRVVVAPDAGFEPRVKVYDGSTQTEIGSFLAYEAGFKGGVRVATADLTGDGVPDLIVTPGAGRAPTLRVFDGATFLPLAGKRGGFDVFASTFKGGVFVAAGDVNGDGTADLVVSQDAGGSPQVRVFDGKTGNQFAGTMGSFLAYASNFKGGVRVASADVNGDGKAEVVTAPGAGTIAGGQTGLVRTFDLTRKSGNAPFVIQQFKPYEDGYAGGVFVATGNLEGDPLPELITAPGGGRLAEVKVFAPNSTVPSRSFTPLPGFTGSLRPAVGDVDGDGRLDLILGAGAGTAAKARFYDAITLNEMFPGGLDPFSPFAGGLFVAGLRTGR